MNKIINDMILGTHNSWTYLKPRKWWMYLLRFTARCQDKDIYEQYTKYGVRSFDLRVRFDGDDFVISHGIIKYKITKEEILKQLDWLNEKGDVWVRYIHELRDEKTYTEERIVKFKEFGSYLEEKYPNIKFWCGRNLFNWEIDYKCKYNPSCEEFCSSVREPKLIDDWYPRLYAWLNNSKIKKNGTDKDIMAIDFVNIG
jgi:hypothetical protein